MIHEKKRETECTLKNINFSNSLILDNRSFQCCSTPSWKTSSGTISVLRFPKPLRIHRKSNVLFL